MGRRRKKRSPRSVPPCWVRRPPLERPATDPLTPSAAGTADLRSAAARGVALATEVIRAALRPLDRTMIFARLLGGLHAAAALLGLIAVLHRELSFPPSNG